MNLSSHHLFCPFSFYLLLLLSRFPQPPAIECEEGGVEEDVVAGTDGAMQDEEGEESEGRAAKEGPEDIAVKEERGAE